VSSHPFFFHTQQLGAHTLSGAVVDTAPLDALLGPDWAARAGPAVAGVPATADRFYALSSTSAFRLPVPPQMRNVKKGCRVLSLSRLVRWLGGEVEAAGADVLPGFAATELLMDDEARGGGVVGVATGDTGWAKDGATRRPGFARGTELRARATLLAEGARGFLAERAVRAFKLREADAGWVDPATGRSWPAPAPQTYALGLKEVWSVPASAHKPGTVWHTVGYPLPGDTYGGGFLYHLADEEGAADQKKEGSGGGGAEEKETDGGAGGSVGGKRTGLVSVGLVIGLDYTDTTLDLYGEFQRFKAHPAVRGVLAGGVPGQYGARVLTEGGWQSLPRLDFPGGALLGCAAGMVDAPRIKGTHTAVGSGVLAADAVYEALMAEREASSSAGGPHQPATPPLSARPPTATPPLAPPLDLSAFDRAVRGGWIGDALRASRNIRPAFKWGLLPGLAAAALDTAARGRVPWTLAHGPLGDRGATRPLPGVSGGWAGRGRPAASPPPPPPPADRRYPPPDGIVTFPLADALFRSGTNHAHDQPCHLTLKNPRSSAAVSAALYGGPEGRFCPAGVYEWVDVRAPGGVGGAPPIKDAAAVAAAAAAGAAHLRISPQNCLHCKACDIKDPSGNVVWVPPEGGGGPAYVDT